ncbi:MAG: DNA-binding protein [Nostoc sp.]|uniref:DNA-binding protein n=1 Tax=Nostoc sp. TaxID=1180 RepID=UPI002FF5ACAF
MILLSPALSQRTNSLALFFVKGNAYAYALLEVAVKTKQKGKPIGVVDDRQNLETEIIGI